MNTRSRTQSGSWIALALALALAAPAFAQAPAAQPPAAGNVQRVEGTAAVERTSLSQAAPLKRKDNVFQRDLVSTGEASKAEFLMGGKALVTMRELSKLRVSEAPGVATLEMTDGRIKLAVKKGAMTAGDRIEVKSPTAITAVRGTIIVVEVLKTPTGVSTLLNVLEGLAEVTPIDPVTGRPNGPPVKVSDLQQTTIRGGSAPTPPVQINKNDAVKLDATFAFKLLTGPPDTDLLKRQTERATSDAAKVPTLPKPPGGIDDSPPTVSGDDIRSKTGIPLPQAPPPRRSPNSGG